MKKIIPLFAICMILFSVPAKADLNAGQAAYDEKEYATALKELTPLAAQGDSQGQYLLGMMYLYGRGVKQNDAEAAIWFAHSARQGSPDAQLMLGMLYNEGKGVPKDTKQAVHWYELAAAQSNANAEYNLGTM